MWSFRNNKWYYNFKKTLAPLWKKMNIRISWIRTSGGLWWKIVQVEFQESFLKMRTSGIRTSWDRTSGGPPVLLFRPAVIPESWESWILKGKQFYHLNCRKRFYRTYSFSLTLDSWLFQFLQVWFGFLWG